MCTSEVKACSLRELNKDGLNTCFFLTIYSSTHPVHTYTRPTHTHTKGIQVRDNIWASHSKIGITSRELYVSIMHEFMTYASSSHKAAVGCSNLALRPPLADDP